MDKKEPEASAASSPAALTGSESSKPTGIPLAVSLAGSEPLKPSKTKNVPLKDTGERLHDDQGTSSLDSKIQEVTPTVPEKKTDQLQAKEDSKTHTEDPNHTKDQAHTKADTHTQESQPPLPPPSTAPEAVPPGQQQMPSSQQQPLSWPAPPVKADLTQESSSQDSSKVQPTQIPPIDSMDESQLRHSAMAMKAKIEALEAEAAQRAAQSVAVPSTDGRAPTPPPTKTPGARKLPQRCRSPKSRKTHLKANSEQLQLPKMMRMRMKHPMMRWTMMKTQRSLKCCQMNLKTT